MKSGSPRHRPQAQRPLLALLPPAGEALERTREAVSQQNQAVLVLGAACWVIGSGDRAERVSQVLLAWRDNADCLTRKDAGRRRLRHIASGPGAHDRLIRCFILRADGWRSHTPTAIRDNGTLPLITRAPYCRNDARCGPDSRVLSPIAGAGPSADPIWLNWCAPGGRPARGSAAVMMRGGLDLGGAVAACGAEAFPGGRWRP